MPNFFFLNESLYYSASLFLGKADCILDVVYILDSVLFLRKVLNIVLAGSKTSR